MKNLIYELDNNPEFENGFITAIMKFCAFAYETNVISPQVLNQFFEYLYVKENVTQDVTNCIANCVAKNVTHKATDAERTAHYLEDIRYCHGAEKEVADLLIQNFNSPSGISQASLGELEDCFSNENAPILVKKIRNKKRSTKKRRK